MCGICGILTFDESSRQPAFAGAVQAMAGLMVRRGPDDAGFWTDPDGHLQLGFRRLSILDLTRAGHQPMLSSDNRSVIVFNGEIYNFQELRRALELTGLQFRSRSDTEVLLEALNLWGVAAIAKLNGMFGFAWYDRRERALVLARDHAGIKPLYYFVHSAGKGLAFASQYNALLHTPWGEPGPVREEVLRLYLRLHHIPPPYGLLENTYQVPPGSYLLVHADGRLEMRTWWKIPEDPEPELRGEPAVELLAEALDRVMIRQRIADVPLGVFLSGGVDSPLVTAIARRQAGPELKAFTIANPGWRQDESREAARYAQAMGVCHRVEPVLGDEALSAIPEVMAAQHEPFADFSILPTLLVSRFARREITVALSGDGGDELFFGYERPLSLLRGGKEFRWPWQIRLALYAMGKLGIGPRRSDVIVSRTPGQYYFEVNCRIKDPDLDLFAPGLKGLPADFAIYADPKSWGLRDLANFSRRVEFYGQLQRGLKKVDMASMHYSLEVRVPLLDREIIDLSLRIDPFYSMHNGLRKAVLRETLARFVPADSIPLPKRGFAVPLGEWLRGPLRPLVEQTLFQRNLYPDGMFKLGGLRQYWEEHLSGRRDAKWGLWTLLTLQWWAETNLKGARKSSV
jgi:asparagine synthase (glutamine-hydrolysing)